MANIIESLKNHFTMVASFVTILTLIIGTYITIDSRYAKAAEVERSIKQFQAETRNYLDDQYRQQLEDRIFELRSKDKLSPTDNAMINRFEQRLELINQRQNRELIK